VSGLDEEVKDDCSVKSAIQISVYSVQVLGSSTFSSCQSYV